MSKLLGACAAVILALMLFSPPAEARCWWNGWGWQCAHVYRPYWHAYYGYPYHYYGWYGPRYYHRRYACGWGRCW